MKKIIVIVIAVHVLLNQERNNCNHRQIRFISGQLESDSEINPEPSKPVADFLGRYGLWPFDPPESDPI